MLMGRIMRKERYSKIQYTIALFLVLGASIFFFSINTLKNNDSIYLIGSNQTKIPGLILMLIYLLLDAFTTNHQKKLMEVKVSCSQVKIYFLKFVYKMSIIFFKLLFFKHIYSIKFILNFKTYLDDVLR